ncbi:hypothetical protein VI06_20555 [Aquitalea magnusonii]|nr:hypothetical protein VI06_20555 [Aquitalea magnusonii]
MGTKLSKAPVYFTVVQAQFNPILNLDSYLSAIQPKMRDAHFPDFQSEVFQRLILPFGGMEGGQVSPPALAPQSRYTFGDIAGRTSFTLESNSLALQTTDYDTFETFLATFLKGLGILHEALRLDFIERIGLRYLDAVLPLNNGESLSDYLVPEVLGLSGRIKGKLQHSVSETVSMVGSSQLVTRVLIREGHIGLPVELAPHAPTIDPRFTQQEASLHAIMDNDASITQREIFSLDKVTSHLNSLHEEIKKAFEATVTDHARATWA